MYVYTYIIHHSLKTTKSIQDMFPFLSKSLSTGKDFVRNGNAFCIDFVVFKECLLRLLKQNDLEKPAN